MWTPNNCNGLLRLPIDLIDECVLTCEDVLNGVGNNEVLVGNETVDGLLIALWYGSLRGHISCNFTD